MAAPWSRVSPSCGSAGARGTCGRQLVGWWPANEAARGLCRLPEDGRRARAPGAGARTRNKGSHGPASCGTLAGRVPASCLRRPTMAVQACWVPCLGWGFDFQVRGSAANARGCRPAAEPGRTAVGLGSVPGLPDATLTSAHPFYFRTVPCRRTWICRISETRWTISLQASAAGVPALK